MAAGSLTLGGNMSLAVGPLGRNGEASTAISTSGKVAAMFVSYRHCPSEFVY
jgi:lipid-binding SYLF domain-containing protein